MSPIILISILILFIANELTAQWNNGGSPYYRGRSSFYTGNGNSFIGENGSPYYGNGQSPFYGGRGYYGQQYDPYGGQNWQQPSFSQYRPIESETSDSFRQMKFFRKLKDN